MVQVEAVRDRESFAAWLEALPENERTETAAIIASRAVLRVFPIWAMLQSSTDFLPLVRTLLVSVVASEFQIPEIKEAARIARDASRAAESAVKVKLPPKGSDVAAYATARKAVSAAAFDAAATAFSNESVVRAVRAMDLTADAADLANAYSASWIALRSDLEATLARENILHHPLWPEGSVPKQLQKVWSLGRASMQDNFGYSFWIRWYEAILAGRPLTGDWQSHWQLMHDIALIAPEDWDKGAEHLAGVIEKLEEKHSYHVSTETQGEATTLLRAALGQFGFNDIRHLMELLPFAEDLKHLKDPDAVSDFVAGMDQQKHEIETFMRAVDREGRSLQGAGGILTYFEEVLTETSKARQLNQLNVGWIIDCGEILQGYAQSSETVAELGPLNIPFQRTVQNLLDLIHSHFSATLLRFGALRDIRSSDETRLADLMEDLRRGLAQIKEGTAGNRVPMAPEAIAVFEKLLDDLDGMIQREFIAGNSAIKSQIRRDIDYRMAQVAVSLRLYWEQSAAPRMAAGQVISGVAKKKLKEGIEGLVQWALDWLSSPGR